MKYVTANSFSDPVGRSGGIWVLWNPINVAVFAVEVTSQAIHATISRVDCEEWIFTAVYGSPNPTCRDLMWHDLQDRTNNDSKARLLAGDFNDHAESSERRSFQRGPKLTWTNNRAGLANTMVRLDRAVCNNNWNLLFPDAVVKNLPRVYFDHAPFIVYTEGIPDTNPSCRTKPFRFEDMWTSHPGFLKVIKDSWNNSTGPFTVNLENEDDIKVHINNHFMGLFCVSNNNTSINWSNWVHNVVSHDENANLALVPNCEEILTTVRNIEAYKAPGPDGFQALFYHKELNSDSKSGFDKFMYETVVVRWTKQLNGLRMEKGFSEFKLRWLILSPAIVK
ncbi:hypothetical protein Vadar_006549 [Vaccinium darrowii]|uniref:Uncharacterized protein n=1 Tax=Vaccinium darrowii TaxID=229202 RepID=A0ACB7Z4I5_9ERIC|nr:hypothetical protein Vadar_006549 [Vaccinium darrowii]